MIVDCQELLSFYDVDQSARTHSNAIKTLAGEELGFALLIDYFNSRGEQAKRMPQKCNSGKNGPRLDGWLSVEARQKRRIYQVEVKSWSIHGFRPGKPFPSTPSEDELKRYRMQKWRDCWDTTQRNFWATQLQKVLYSMKTDSIGYTDVLPLACVWEAMHPQGLDDPFFVVELPTNHTFRELHVFSQSAYVRKRMAENGLVEIDLELPDTEARLAYLSRIFRR